MEGDGHIQGLAGRLAGVVAMQELQNGQRGQDDRRRDLLLDLLQYGLQALDSLSVGLTSREPGPIEVFLEFLRKLRILLLKGRHALHAIQGTAVLGLQGGAHLHTGPGEHLADIQCPLESHREHRHLRRTPVALLHLLRQPPRELVALRGQGRLRDHHELPRPFPHLLGLLGPRHPHQPQRPVQHMQRHQVSQQPTRPAEHPVSHHVVAEIQEGDVGIILFAPLLPQLLVGLLVQLQSLRQVLQGDLLVHPGIIRADLELLPDVLLHDCRI
mmetsp:Transcript_25867/g.62529  ORF Transcript_25867/g.62529 Transcript_25867/m.62529 type:complete len:271 (-) Transcript_25867:502-1314(-)